MVPGSNLLFQAMQAITPTTIQYVQASGRTVNAVGQYTTAYNAPVPVTASVQAVDRSLYQEFGLDFQKDYVMIFGLTQVDDLDRDYSGDLFQLANGRTYQVVSEADWFKVDGWVGPLIAVKLPNVAVPPFTPLPPPPSPSPTPTPTPTPSPSP